MSRRRALLTLAVVFLGILLGSLWTHRNPSGSSAAQPGASTHKTPSATAGDLPGTAKPVATDSASGGMPGAVSPTTPVEARIALADDLNSPTGTIQRDLRVLQDLLDAWRSNFPHTGNPVGENADITAALSGGNSLNLALIAKDHPAINSDGQICDRWGTPFRFHQLAAEFMEIDSAGPDKKFGTADDVKFIPEGANVAL